MKRKAIIAIINFCIFPILLLVFRIYQLKNQSKGYEAAVNSSLAGIITDKYRIEPDNPKAYNIKINDSIVFYIPFGLIDQIEANDKVQFDVQEGRKGLNAVNVKRVV